MHPRCTHKILQKDSQLKPEVSGRVRPCPSLRIRHCCISAPLTDIKVRLSASWVIRLWLVPSKQLHQCTSFLHLGAALAQMRSAGAGSMLSALSELRRGGPMELPSKKAVEASQMLRTRFESAGWSIGSARPAEVWDKQAYVPSWHIM